MARRRKGRPIDGVLVLDKPSGLSSNAALQHTKRLYSAAKAGHTAIVELLREAQQAQRPQSGARSIAAAWPPQ